MIGACLLAGLIMLNPKEYAALGESAAFAGVGLWNLYFYANTICNADGCLTKTGPGVSTLTAFDGGHLTAVGADYFIKTIASQIDLQNEKSEPLDK